MHTRRITRITAALLGGASLYGLVIASPALCFAQTSSPTQAFGFAFDAGLATTREDLLVPRALSGPRLALGPRYAVVLGPGALHAEFHLGAAAEFDRDGNLGIALDHALDAQYTFRIGRTGALRHAVGPALGWDTDIAGIVSWDNAHAYWIATRWLGAAWRGFTPAFDGYRWDFAAELPLVALVSRPPVYRANKQDALDQVGFYFFDVQAHSKLVAWNDWEQLRLSADLWHSRAKSFVPSGWALGVESRIAHAAEPRSAVAFRMTFRFTAMWGW